MNNGAYRKVIQFYKAHGIKGGVKGEFLYPLLNEQDLPEFCIVNKGNSQIPYFFERIEITTFPNAIFYFEEFSSRDKAEEFKNLNGSIEESSFEDYFSEDNESILLEYIGFEAFENGDPIGRIEDILFLNGQDLFKLNHHGRQVLIPVNEDLIQSVDQDKKIIEFTLPEGLLNL